MHPGQDKKSGSDEVSDGVIAGTVVRWRSRWTIALGAVVAVLTAAAALYVGFGGGDGRDNDIVHEFASRPDLSPPKIRTVTEANGVQPGSMFISPMIPKPEEVDLDDMPQAGPLIVDDQGQPVWFEPDPPGLVSMDFKRQEYRGEPVMTRWRGEMIAPPGFGRGEVVIMDQSYREVATVRAGNGIQTDMHDFVITPRDTGLLMSYREVPVDLTSLGGSADAPVLEGVVQEVDIETGEVLFEWHSLDHVGIEESLQTLPEDPEQPWDYFHINSVETDGLGKLLVSARNTHAIYQLNQADGAVNWRLSGKNTDFAMGEGTVFEWQHDARRQPDGTITLFDNADGATGKDRSRGVALRVDERARTVELVRDDPRSEPKLSPNMANYQMLGNGHAFIGWGGADGFTEYGPDGTVLLDGTLPAGMASYRAFRFPWVGKPQDAPAVAGEEGSGDETVVYASWNGATEVVGWRVLAGPGPQDLATVRDAARSGFETRIEFPARERYVAVEALNQKGRVVGRSEPVEVSK